MRIAVIGSRNLEIKNIGEYMSKDCDEIVSGGAKGVDSSAAEFAREKGILLTEFFPNYEKYGRGAPIVRNKQIVDYSDEVIAFWDGKSRGTLSVIKYCEKIGVPCKVVLCE